MWHRSRGTARRRSAAFAFLCDFLVINGVLAKENGRYKHTPSSAAFLDPAFTGVHGFGGCTSLRAGGCGII